MFWHEVVRKKFSLGRLCVVQVCTLSSLLPLPLLGLVPNTSGSEEVARGAGAEEAIGEE